MFSQVLNFRVRMLLKGAVETFDKIIAMELEKLMSRNYYR